MTKTKLSKMIPIIGINFDIMLKYRPDTDNAKLIDIQSSYTGQVIYRKEPTPLLSLHK